MPLFLIPLAFSLLSAGVGLYNGAKNNDTIAREGRLAVDEQLARNEAAQLDNFATYVRTIDAINAQTDATRQAEAQRAIKTGQTITTALFATAGLLLLLTIWTALRAR